MPTRSLSRACGNPLLLQVSAQHFNPTDVLSLFPLYICIQCLCLPLAPQCATLCIFPSHMICDLLLALASSHRARNYLVDFQIPTSNNDILILFSHTQIAFSS
jgi:hypothetical protein